MSRQFLTRFAIVLLGLLGAGINLAYAGSHFESFMATGTPPAEREAQLSAVCGSAGIALAMIWMAFRPLQRKGLLLVGAFSMFVGNLLHSFLMWQMEQQGVVANLIFGAGFAGVYIAVYGVSIYLEEIS